MSVGDAVVEFTNYYLHEIYPLHSCEKVTDDLVERWGTRAGHLIGHSDLDGDTLGALDQIGALVLADGTRVDEAVRDGSVLLGDVLLGVLVVLGVEDHPVAVRAQAVHRVEALDPVPVIEHFDPLEAQGVFAARLDGHIAGGWAPHDAVVLAALGVPAGQVTPGGYPEVVAHRWSLGAGHQLGRRYLARRWELDKVRAAHRDLAERSMDALVVALGAHVGANNTESQTTPPGPPAPSPSPLTRPHPEVPLV